MIPLEWKIFSKWIDGVGPTRLQKKAAGALDANRRMKQQ